MSQKTLIDACPETKSGVMQIDSHLKTAQGASLDNERGPAISEPQDHQKQARNGDYHIIIMNAELMESISTSFLLQHHSELL